MDLKPHIDRFSKRFAELEAALSDPSAFENKQRAQELAREYASLKELIGSGQQYLKVLSELEENRALLKSEAKDSDLGAMAQEEIKRLEGEERRLGLEVQRGILPPDPADSRNTIIEIRAGAGGSESALFAADLYRMYTRYAEGQGWKVETLDSSPSDLGGFKEVIFSVTGTDVYKRLKYESGVHRVQRVPATEAQGRIHTSTATVAVLPEAQEVDVEIRPDELDITVCRASGPGGQGVNTTDSAVQIIHKPSGLIVRCADQRSQQKNKARALTVLRSRLLEARIAEENAKYAAQRKAQVGTGERNERIRTYNFPQNRVTDHRIELTLYNLPAFMAGEIDSIVDPLMTHGLEERMAALKLSLTVSIQGLIFDCDGTLADTMPLHWKAWQIILERHRLHLPEARFYALGGVPSRDILKVLAEEQGVSLDHHAVAKEKESAYLPFIPQVEPIRLVVDIAYEHFGKLPMAVASGGSRTVIEQVLVHLGIRHLFKAMVTNEDVVRQKPAPDIFLEAARRIGVPPQHCRGYEDTDLGLEAIRTAGMEAIDVRELLASRS